MKKTQSGKNYKFGEVVLAEVYFTDLNKTKRRPALVLFEEYNNIVVMGITSNINMDGIHLKKKDGAIVDSIIKINYIFTISKNMVIKSLFSISQKKKEEVCKRLIDSIGCEKI